LFEPIAVARNPYLAPAPAPSSPPRPSRARVGSEYGQRWFAAA
jgi:hypothetical protein